MTNSIEELAAKLEARADGLEATIPVLRAMDAANKASRAASDAALDRAAALKLRECGDERQKLANSLFRVSVGGNHVACVIGADHPPYTASEGEAAEHYGSDMDKLNSWICWSIIMDETRTVYDQLPEEVKNACWQWWKDRRAAKALEGK